MSTRQQDYLALEENKNTTKHGLGNVADSEIKTIGGTSAQLIRAVLLPVIEKEVNEGKNFANLRQIYNSMILATWYKKKLKDSLLSQLYLDQNKINGIELEDKNVKEKIYNQYLNAFKKGVTDVIKEEYDPATQEVIAKKYVTGGLTKVDAATLGETDKLSKVWIERQKRRNNVSETVELQFLDGHREEIATMLKVLEYRDYEREDLEARNIQDLVVLGNDQLDTFREILKLLVSNIGKRIVILGGYGRLTIPLIDKAVKYGYRIKIAENTEVDSHNWESIKLKTIGKDQRQLIQVSEAEIIRQIMVKMIESEQEFESLRTRLVSNDLFFLEESSQNTPGNLENYRKILTEDGKLDGSKPHRALFIQTPHQQLRSKATFDVVFQSDIAQEKIEGINFTIHYDQDSREKNQVVEDLVSEAWRLAIYSLAGFLNLQSVFPQRGLEGIPLEFWKSADKLFESLSNEEQYTLAINLIALLPKPDNQIMEKISLLPEAIQDLVKRILNTPTRIFNDELNKSAVREGITLDNNTKIALFIGGPHVANGYYYKLFDDVLRKQFGHNIVYLPFPVEEQDKQRLELVKQQLKVNPTIIGAVITRPWKEEFSEEGNQIGAVNYIIKEQANGNLRATATDGQAWIDGLNHDLGYEYDFKGKNIMIIGSGGAARELVDVLNRKGINRITITDVDEKKLDSLRRMIGTLSADYQSECLPSGDDRLPISIQQAHIIINATGIGRQNTKGVSPLNDHSLFHEGQIVSDLISNEDTQILKEARTQGVEKAFNGRSMFIYGMVVFMKGWIEELTGTDNTPSEDELYRAIDEWLDTESAEAGKPSNAKGKIHFLLNNHATFAKYIEQVKSRVSEADIILNEDPDILDDIYTAVSNGHINPEEAMRQFEERALRLGVTVRNAEMRYVLLKIFYKSGKKIYGEKVSEPISEWKRRSDEAWNHFIGNLVNGNGAEALRWYEESLAAQAKTFSLREELLKSQLIEHKEANQGSNILVIRGTLHTPPYGAYKKAFPSYSVTREFLGNERYYQLYEASQRSLSFQDFGLKKPKKFLTTKLIQSMISQLLSDSASKRDPIALNKIVKRIDNKDVFERLVFYIRDNPPKLNASEVIEPEELYNQLSRNIRTWFISNGFATQEELANALDADEDGKADNKQSWEINSSLKQNPGGIDFNSNNLNLKEHGQGSDINFSFEALQNIQPNAVNGILPVIINISPITNFYQLLGLSEKQPTNQLDNLSKEISLLDK